MNSKQGSPAGVGGLGRRHLGGPQHGDGWPAVEEPGVSGATATDSSHMEAGTEGGGAGGQGLDHLASKVTGTCIGFVPRTWRSRGGIAGLAYVYKHQFGCGVDTGTGHEEGLGFLGDLCGPADRGWGLSPGWRDADLTSKWTTGIIGERHSNLCSR